MNHAMFLKDSVVDMSFCHGLNFVNKVGSICVQYDLLLCDYFQVLSVIFDSVGALLFTAGNIVL